MSTQAQHQVRRQVMAYIGTHPGVAVHEHDWEDGGVSLRVVAAPFAVAKQAVDELGRQLGTNAQVSNDERYAALHLPASNEPQWVPSNVLADVVVYTDRDGGAAS